MPQLLTTPAFIFGLSLSILLAPNLHSTPLPNPDIATAKSQPLGAIVTVTGIADSVIPTHAGSKTPAKIQLQDETGSLCVVLWADVYEAVTKLGPLSPGDKITVTGRISNFRGDPQIKLETANHIRIEPTTAAAPGSAPLPTVPLASINASLLGKTVRVTARIQQIRPPKNKRAPYVVTLEQENAFLPLVLWSDAYDERKEFLSVGTPVCVTGIVQDHKGMIQLKLRAPADLTGVKP